MPFSDSLFLNEFITETQQRLEIIVNGIIYLKDNPRDKDKLSLLLNQLHIIKGTSRMLGFSNIEKLSNGLEDVFKGLYEDKYGLTEHITQLTFETSECTKRILKKIKETGTDDINIDSFMASYAAASMGLFFSIEQLKNENREIPSATEETDSTKDIADLENIKSISIDIEKIDEVIRLFENIIIRQFRFKHLLEEYELNNNNEFPRHLKEEMTLIENSIFETQHSILNLRMLPLNRILEPLKRYIETTAHKLNKQVIIDIPSTDILMDKKVLEQLKEILLQLTKNCLEHGIDKKGCISIKGQQISSRVVISVCDDGRGLPYELIREKACSLFPMQTLEISSMTEKELQQYIFMAGFSTKDSSPLSHGTGAGLDIVRTNMEKLKGRIHIDSESGKGTAFELTIPTSLATQQGLFITLGKYKYMIPSHYVRQIIDTDEDDFTVIQSQTFINQDNQLIPVYFLSSIINNSEKSNNTSTVILLEYLESRVAIVADKVLRQETVVVNNMPPILKNLKPLQGLVYDENYSIIPILNIPDIMQRIKNLYTYDLKKYKSKNEKRIYKTLIVDDSITTRQIEETILKSDGYDVETASDGIEALGILKNKHIDIIISDINMPRMDGKVLLNNIRRIKEYSLTPFIIVSAVYDKNQKEDFLALGANAFITKSDFKREDLLHMVKEMLNEQ